MDMYGTCETQNKKPKAEEKEEKKKWAEDNKETVHLNATQHQFND
jgi:hypothetical protein